MSQWPIGSTPKQNSRSRIPGLRIDKSEWKDAEATVKADKATEKKNNEMQADIAEGALLNGGAAWDISEKGLAKKRKSEVKGRRPKKRKLEKLVGWGEDDDLEDGGTLETWVEKTVAIQDGETQHSVQVGVKTVPEQKSILMEQLETSFKTEMASTRWCGW